MPSKSKSQHNAMEAACHGKSTLGIPKDVGCEYAAADKAKKRPYRVEKPVKIRNGKKVDY